MGRIKELDGLRAIAALLVIAWHYVGIPDGPTYWMWNVFHVGHFGVDLFFVLSGFLITTILLEHRNSPSYFSSFYGRRAFRIWPIYYLMVAICIVGYVTGTKPYLFDGAVPMWTYLLGLQNFWMAKTQSYGNFWLSPTWSLAIEEQFYLVFPLVVRYVPVRHLPKILAVIIVVCPLARLADSFTDDEFGFYVLPQFRADVLAIGALIAWYRFSGLNSPAVSLNIRRLLIASTCLVPLIPVSGSATFHGAAWQHTLAAIFFGATVFKVLENRGASYLSPLRGEIAAHFARWSYASYMTHHCVAFLLFAAFRVPRTMTTASGVAMTVVAFVATFALCALSYRFLEKPLIQRAHVKYDFKGNSTAVAPAS